MRVPFLGLLFWGTRGRSTISLSSRWIHDASEMWLNHGVSGGKLLREDPSSQHLEGKFQDVALHLEEREEREPRAFQGFGPAH